MFEYIKKYGHLSFSDMPLTEVDNVILSTIAYADFNGIISPKSNRHYAVKDFGTAAEIYLSTRTKKSVARYGTSMKNAYETIELAVHYPRYREMGVGHYRYIIDSDTQFSALTFRLTHDTKFIAFEGTDEMISGWKEDFYMPFRFPVDAHTYAINYLNETVSIFDRNLILGGHSKGGNLALVAGMYARRSIRHHIRHIYSNDGPGLRKTEFNSPEFARIKHKYTHIIPESSLIGVALYHDQHQVIASTKKNIFSHSTATWITEDDHFRPAKLRAKSAHAEVAIIECLEKIPESTLEQVTYTIFNSMQRLGIATTLDLFSISSIAKVIKDLRGVDKETKKLISKVVSIIYREFSKK